MRGGKANGGRRRVGYVAHLAVYEPDTRSHAVIRRSGARRGDCGKAMVSLLEGLEGEAEGAGHGDGEGEGEGVWRGG